MAHPASRQTPSGASCKGVCVTVWPVEVCNMSDVMRHAPSFSCPAVEENLKDRQYKWNKRRGCGDFLCTFNSEARSEIHTFYNPLFQTCMLFTIILFVQVSGTSQHVSSQNILYIRGCSFLIPEYHWLRILMGIQNSSYFAKFSSIKSVVLI